MQIGTRSGRRDADNPAGPACSSGPRPHFPPARPRAILHAPQPSGAAPARASAGPAPGLRQDSRDRSNWHWPRQAPRQAAAPVPGPYSACRCPARPADQAQRRRHGSAGSRATDARAAPAPGTAGIRAGGTGACFRGSWRRGGWKRRSLRSPLGAAPRCPEPRRTGFSARSMQDRCSQSASSTEESRRSGNSNGNPSRRSCPSSAAAGAGGPFAVR